ncbi:response regulator transcription factor [Paenibacillus spiritus]|uniref:Response regulator transcription factor n=1 Tax=Paenibacillus spiritus TaxID=2496557 RepID=A0A5J5GCU5_9BACL|nr:response regulator transcription factor [Paenibacillus spiritus]KAA9005827.1 response regulator transcription factor [Paenibacillus spiritus]
MPAILIVEDDVSLNRGIALSLGGEGLEIRQAYTLGEAEKLWREQGADLVLLDIQLPDGSGLEFCRQLREGSGVPVIFLTANDWEGDIVAGLELGGDDYITKPFSLMVLRARVRAVLRRTAVPEERARFGDMVFDFGRMEIERDGGRIPLSRTEQRLLKTLLRSRGRVLTRAALMESVWSGETEYVDENALSVTVKRLRAKLGDDPASPRWIRTVYGVGYVWTEEVR